jgi:hypothetical protein
MLSYAGLTVFVPSYACLRHEAECPLSGIRTLEVLLSHSLGFCSGLCSSRASFCICFNLEAARQGFV